METVSEMKVSNDALNEPEELRRRIDRDGYMFFRGLLDPEVVWNLRVRVLEVLRERGWLKAGTELVDGIADTSKICVEPEPQYLDVYNHVLKLEAFNRLAHQPAILRLMETLIEETVLVHPMKISRLIFPQNTAFSTPPHQDFVPIQGTTDTYTCWIPLGDCPREHGGLTVRAGSHERGVYELHLTRGLGGMAMDIDKVPGDWVTTDYRLGDALVFHSLTVHKALPNQSPDRFRLSVDYRFSPSSQPIVEKELVPTYNLISWEDVYAGWESMDGQYYWKEFDLDVVRFDWRHEETVHAEAFEAAQRGDDMGRNAFQRIISRHPDAEKRRAAEEALQALDAQKTKSGSA